MGVMSMKKLKYSLLAVLLVPTVLWLMADTLFPEPFTYFSFRHVFVQYSGVMAMVVMSVAILLAIRPKWLEPRLDGLDKMYRFHKWLGISALVFSVSHWWFAKGTKWMVGWGWLEKPARGPRSEEILGFWEGLFRSQRELAETIGEWTFYAAAILLILALIKRFPYHWFAKTHQLLAVAYLLFAFHAVVLLEFSYWSQPVGWMMALLLALGVIAAFWVLSGKVGARRKVSGVITSIENHPEMQVIEVEVKVDAGWPGHRAGQFAFASANPREGAHPYTIASAWDPQTRKIKFIIKALGDHTARLSHWLQKGLKVKVEGPYGCFDFHDDRPRQIWIGAGIGVTPFVARMKQLAAAPEDKEIDFFHATSKMTDTVRAKLLADVAASGVTLHLTESGRGERLEAQKIMTEVADWKNASIWFCGPVALGDSLRKTLLENGFPEKHFHQELFNFR